MRHNNIIYLRRIVFYPGIIFKEMLIIKIRLSSKRHEFIYEKSLATSNHIDFQKNGKGIIFIMKLLSMRFVI